MNKEQRGIYNVTFGKDNATPIFKDIEAIEDTVIEYIAMYVKGYHSTRKDRGFGAEHIKLHLEKGSEGYITIEELLNLGNSIREYLRIFKIPFLDKDGRKIYEWQDENEVRFRVVTDSLSQKGLEKNFQTGGSQLPLSPFESTIITYYSDRNAKTPLFFKNPKVQGFYDKHESRTNSAESKPKLRRHK